MDGKKPGEITIIDGIGDKFTPYFKNGSGNWCGLGCNDYTIHYKGYTENWKIYEEPKKLIKKWLWVFKEPGCTFYNISLTLMTEEEAADNFDHEDSYYKYGTGIEVKE